MTDEQAMAEHDLAAAAERYRIAGYGERGRRLREMREANKAALIATIQAERTAKVDAQ